MKGYFSNRLGSAAFLLATIAVLAGGCNRPGSKDSGSNATAPVAVSQLSPSLAGKRITVRGKLFMFKCGQGIQLDNGDVVCLVNMPPKSAFGDPYAGMNDKPPLEVTGTLRFFHDSTPPDAGRPLERQHDHYYFEYSTTQVRLMTEYMNNSTISAGASQLSQALVGKRITIRGKLLLFKCGPSIGARRWGCNLSGGHASETYFPSLSRDVRKTRRSDWHSSVLSRPHTNGRECSHTANPGSLLL